MEKKWIYALTLLLVLGVGFVAYRSGNESGNGSSSAGGGEVSEVASIDVSEGKDFLVPVSFAEVAKHSSKESCWTVIDGFVYDLSSWIAQHPGGERAILSLCGQDGTERFNKQHGEFNQALNVLKGLRFGILE